MAAPSPKTFSAWVRCPSRSSRGWGWRKQHNRRRNGARYSSSSHLRGFGLLLLHWVGNSSQPGVGFGPLQLVPQPLQNRADDILLAARVATGAHTQRDHSVHLLLDFPHQANNLFGAFYRHFDFDNRRKNLLTQDV